MQKVTKIEIQRAEGPNTADFSLQTVSSFDEADALLRRMGETAPEPGRGYDKCDFVVYWGEEDAYKGRFDLQKGGKDGDCTLREHIQNALLFYAGKMRPSHMSEEKYLAFLSLPSIQERLIASREMLAKVEI